MTAIAAGAAAAAAVVTVALAVLRAPLLAVLTDLCRGQERARFWWRVVTIEVAAGAALCASLSVLLVSRAGGWRVAATMAQGAVAGLLVSLVAVMAGVLAFQRERDRAG